METKLLQIKDLTIEALSGKGSRIITEGVSLNLNKGEILGVVGESGSGKSMTALSVLGLLPRGVRTVRGEVLYNGRNVFDLSEEGKRAFRGREASMVFQEPMTSLNPVIKVGIQVEEALLLHGVKEKKERKERTLDMLSEVGLGEVERLYHNYPHQLSGGMRQRVMIAMAMVCKPGLLIADEPTTALDAQVQEVILKLIRRMSQKYGTAVLFISHDIGVVKGICERAVVMCGGIVVERGKVTDLFGCPQAEYTKRLLEALPSREKRRIRETEASKEKVLKIRNLNVYYNERKTRRQVLHNVSFDLYRGEILGLVGRSGIGKSTIAKAIVELVKEREGRIKRYENKIQMVFQDPYGSLNPAKKVGWILEEPLKIQGGYTKEERRERVREVLHQVGLEEEHLKRGVSRLSGGQRQRVAIACAIMCNPDVIILDEPISALDVTVQDKVLALLSSIRERYDVSYLLISHDMAVLDQMCDRVIRMDEITSI